MQNKESFVLYTKYIDTFKELTDEQAGKLIKVILEYVNDLNPEPEGLVKIAFIPIDLVYSFKVSLLALYSI